MSMRVATISIYNNSKADLSRSLSSYNAAANTVTTGKRIQSPSDDPVGYSKVMDINSTLSQLDQLHSNINTGLEWLNTTESTLNSVLDTISEAKQLSIAATNGTYSDEDYATAAVQVDELLAQLEDYANTSVSGHYLFSGTKTDTQPYTVDETAVPPAQVVTYSGNDDAFTISTGIGSRTEVSYTGSEVFGDELVDSDGDGVNDDLFSLLIDMSNALSTSYTDDTLVSATSFELDDIVASAGDSFEFTVGGGAPVTVSFAADMTLEDMVDAINAAGTDATASIMEVEDGQYALVLTADVSGQSISVTQDDTDLNMTMMTKDVKLGSIMTKLDKHFESVNNLLSDVGIKTNRLETKDSVVSDFELTLTEQKSNLEDVDLTDAATELALRETAYQAALSATSSIISLSLVDYL